MEIDKNKDVISSVKLVNNKLHFVGSVCDNEPIDIDYIPPFGDNLGYTSLELLLLSLSSCIGSAVLIFLRRMNKSIFDFNIQSHGVRKDEHPTGFDRISLKIFLKSSDVTKADLEKIIELVEDKYCPVWSMIKGNTTVNVDFEIDDE